MSNEIEVLKDNISLFSSNIFKEVNESHSYDFDDPEDNFWQNFEKLNHIEFLHRMIGSKDEKKIYVLKDYELESKKISLFDLKKEFLDKNSHLCVNDCFLQFMFFVVMEKKTLSEKYMMNKKIANLIIKKILQLANTDEIFKSKVEYIDISPLDEQNFIENADHWDLKYVEEHHSEDNDIQQLLYNCTEIYDVSNSFIYSNNLVLQDEIESNSQVILKLT